MTQNLIPELRLEVIWSDEHFAEICVSARSVDFSGRTVFYASLDECLLLAEKIAGFPQTTADVREHCLGASMTAELGQGEVKLQLWCRDGTGTVGLTVELYKYCKRSLGHRESVKLELSTVASGIDNFVQELRAMSTDVGQTARLVVL